MHATPPDGFLAPCYPLLCWHPGPCLITPSQLQPVTPATWWGPWMQGESGSGEGDLQCLKWDVATPPGLALFNGWLVGGKAASPPMGSSCRYYMEVAKPLRVTRGTASQWEGKKSDLSSLLPCESWGKWQHRGGGLRQLSGPHLAQVPRHEAKIPWVSLSFYTPLSLSAKRIFPWIIPCLGRSSLPFFKFPESSLYEFSLWSAWHTFWGWATKYKLCKSVILPQSWKLWYLCFKLSLCNIKMNGNLKLCLTSNDIT